MPRRPRRFWLLKSEPDVFSIDDLAAEPERTTRWEGIRNYKARNYLRDEVARLDGVLFYHSSTTPLGVAGTARVVRAAYPDPTQFDPASPTFDPKSAPEEPRWVAIDIQLVEKFAVPVTVTELRGTPDLSRMILFTGGSRLSVQPVTAAEWRAIAQLARRVATSSSRLSKGST